MPFHIMCVVETQVNKTRVERLASTFGYDNCFAVSSEGRSGGLGIFWNNDANVKVFRFSKYHIQACVLGIGNGPWRVTVVYGEAQTNERHKTWDTLKGIKSKNNLPWCAWKISMKCYGKRNMRLLVSIPRRRWRAFVMR